MTQTPLAPSAAARQPGTRIALRTLAIAATLPYIALKVAWVLGSRIGIPDGSPLLDHRTTMIVANGITILMDSAVVVITLLLTQAWGRRVPAWLLVLPMWVASGLLLPIMTGYPLQMVVGLARGGDSGSGEPPFLDGWVFGIVYGGFILQGLALGALFALYTRDRWGHLWKGALRDLAPSPTGPALRTTAVVASLLAIAPAVMHLVWATGSTAGLSEGGIADRNDVFYLMEALSSLFAVAAAAGVLLLAFRRRSALPLAVPLALAWGGSAASACWGGWMSLASLTAAEDLSEQATPAMMLIYGVQMLLGALVVTLGGYFFSERAAALPVRSAGSPATAPAARPSGARA
ncbi:hypothetical protein OG978_10280 [Streptomyces sp. NBC_01591]|uniref:hypothetical protein n=1 Tax=Streptomyces sp. NBC_01591 TaxID=2975888 RepID=UPI002DD8FE3F|nr:hypothetical protein [Streptomyces sp. NBC_01591]WSD67738.1 hypothetical protein OG978_10280 [Streptomyces sp. NBC_01591]